MEETWKDIAGYEGYYQVSNLGNVRSVDRVVKFGRKLNGKNHPQFTGKDGYLVVSLSKDGKAKHHTVHRLVAAAFVENPFNLTEVNHKDENKKNNRFDNLEWCTTRYNINYGSRNKKVSEALCGEKSYAHKVSNKEVLEIRRMYKTGDSEFGAVALSKKYGISTSQIYKIAKRTRWKHI